MLHEIQFNDSGGSTVQNDTHVIILPYFCQDEVRRFIKVSDRLSQFPEPACNYHFLLASSPKISPDETLYRAFSRVGPCTLYSCPTQVFGYPEGPTAMYWDSMEFVAQKFGGKNRGFCLWFESDMAPVKPDWLDRLSEEWYQDEPPLMMGCHVPDTYKKRLFRKPKLILNAHINGGACYATDFARRLPASARRGVFDMAVYQHALHEGGIRKTDQIAFSSLNRVRRDVQCPKKVVLHGFMQDKDRFIEECLRPVTDSERQASVWHPLQDQFELLRRRIRVQFIRRGHRAMLENVMLAKHQAETSHDAA